MLISSVTCYNDWKCDPNKCPSNCCTLKTATVDDACYDATGIPNFNSTASCPGRNSATASCIFVECSSGCCSGAMCNPSKDDCNKVASAIGCCYIACVCAIVLIPIMILVLIIVLCMKPKR